MNPLVYMLEFKGRSRPKDETRKRIGVEARAHSCSVTTAVSGEGIASRFVPVGGGEAEFDSLVTITGEGRFDETGIIKFGGGAHWIRFVTESEGRMEPASMPGFSRGSIVWRIEGGGGQFEKANGIITSNFVIGPKGEVTDYQTGVIFLG